MLTISIEVKTKGAVSALAGPHGPKGKYSPYSIEPGPNAAKFDNLGGKSGVKLTSAEGATVLVTNISDDADNGAEGPAAMFKIDGQDSGRIPQNASASLDIAPGSELWVGNLV